MNTALNPFSNRWALLFIVALFLLLVSELIGTDEQGGVLSRVAGSQATAGDADAPPAAIEVIEQPAAPEVIDDADEVPEEDLPQIISAEDVEDQDLSSDGGEQDQQIEIIEQPVEDEPVQ